MLSPSLRLRAGFVKDLHLSVVLSEAKDLYLSVVLSEAKDLHLSVVLSEAKDLHVFVNPNPEACRGPSPGTSRATRRPSHATRRLVR